MFAYEVMKEDEAMNERFQLLPAGEYDAVISASQDKMSSSGNPMMDMSLSVFDNQGMTHEIRDFLVFTRKMMWKIIHCAQSADVVSEYESRRFCSECVIGRKVRVKIAIEEGTIIPDAKLNGKTAGSRYNDQNRIVDYIKQAAHKNNGQVMHQQAIIDKHNDAFDDIPF